MPNEINAAVRRRFIVQGIVQGVGFRPFVYGQALRRGLGGFVLNDSRGVVIEVEGAAEAVAEFARALREEAPPLAQIDAVLADRLPTLGETTFAITTSQSNLEGISLIPPDVGTCDDCLHEIADATDRRYGYPFTNCTNCGPRFTIIEDMPYDREKTTMREFPLCPACQAEYNDPLNRRFFAQPNACPICGPRVRLLDALGDALEVADPIAAAAERLAGGALLAIKGLGGYALACNALDQAAVQRLRRHKCREGRPFALMVPNLEIARQLCDLSEAEARLLEYRQRPIVLLCRREGCPLPRDIAPSHSTLGLLLPYTPLHHLLMRAYAAAIEPDRPPVLVMTRSSLDGKPIVYQDDDALAELLPATDGMLMHNRAISVRCNDSVTRVVRGEEQVLRRSRGYVPQPIRLPIASPMSVLACGGRRENTFCFVKERQAFISQHLGNLLNPETLKSFHESIAHFQHLFGDPEAIVYDLDSTDPAAQYAFDVDISHKIGVQHQHAHIASVMAEHGVEEAVIGVVVDNPSPGADSALWGCEVMIADLFEFERQAHLAYVQLPSGNGVIRQPWQMAVAYLAHVYGSESLGHDGPFLRGLPQHQRDHLTNLATLATLATGSGERSTSSSLACLFDAVAALIGLRHDALYEGQAANELEAIAQAQLEPYPFAMGLRATEVLEVADVIQAIIADLKRNVPIHHIAGRFHSTIAEMLAMSCRQVRRTSGLNVVALSGDLLQNRLLLEQLIGRLEGSAFQVLINRQVPPNDGGLSFGQAAIGAARLRHYPN